MLLVGFEERDYCSGDGEAGGVQRVEEFGFAFVVAFEADVGAAGLVVGEVAAAAAFEPFVGAGRPDLDVVAFAGAEAEVGGGEGDDTVVQAEGLQDVFGGLAEGFDFVPAIFGFDEFNHFDFVELVDAHDAARIFAGGSGFAAEAGRVGDVVDGQVVAF